MSEVSPRPCSHRADDGITIVYEDWGPMEAPAVLLCHGIASAGEQLRADARFFAAAGYRVLLPDLRGHGGSGRAPAVDKDGYSIARMGDDMVGIIGAAGAGAVHWVGNSLGGIIALPLLASRPALFRSFASFGTPYRQQLPSWTPATIPLAHRILGAGLRGRLTAALTTRNRAARPLVARLVQDSDPDAGYRIALNACRYDFSAAVRDTEVPLLLLRGGRDAAVNAALAPVLAELGDRPGLTAMDLPQGGHCANLDATDSWRVALLEFWARVPADADPAVGIMGNGGRGGIRTPDAGHPA